MLTHEVMGVFALGVLWLNTVLVVLAALARARGLSKRRAAMRPLDPLSPEGYGVLKGRLESVSSGPPAELVIEQIGRHAAGPRRAILWHDRAHASIIRAGAIVVGDRTFAVEPASEQQAEVWLDPPAVTAAAACDGGTTFDATYPAAKKARGSVRTVRVEIAPAMQVWVVGHATIGEGSTTIGPRPGAPLIVATIDPRAWLSRSATQLWLFAPIALVLCAACTAVALHPPVFDGVVSKVGGLLCFVFFLLVLPAGTRMRDFTTAPNVRALRGRWDDPTATSK